MTKLTLISHVLCPYVQRAVISLTEKRVPFERIDVDLANKPQWFIAISPLGKTPVLKVDETAIFESAVILEYLEETQPCPLHPSDPLRRAEHRAWIEFGSAVLNDIAGFYGAVDEAVFTKRPGTWRTNSNGSRHGLNRGLAAAPISTVSGSRSSTRYSDPSSAISMFSIESVSSTFSPANPRPRRIGSRCQRVPRCAPPCRPTTTAGLGRFSRREIQNCLVSWPPSATTGLKTGLAGRKRRRTPRAPLRQWGLKELRRSPVRAGLIHRSRRRRSGSDC